MPWKQQFVILHRNKLYIYNKETDDRAQKILTLSNFCKFLSAPEEKSKDVPWPFVLRARTVEQSKSEFFCVTSEHELQKWEDAVTPGLGEEDTLSEESSDGDYDDIEDIDKSPKPQGRTVPTTPDHQQGARRADRALPPVPSPTGDNEIGLRGRKVPAIPGMETKSESSEQPTKKSPPPIAIKRNERPPTKKKPQVPVPGFKPALPPMSPVQDDLTYELGIVDAALWKKQPEEAQEYMKQSGLPEGLYLIRKSTDGSGYTLIAICQGLPCKFKIDEDAELKVKMGSSTFAGLEALILHFGETNLPNKTTPLTKAYSQYKPK